MVSYCGKSGLFINHFRCITEDINSNKHMPDDAGKLDGYIVENGDELYDIKARKAYIWSTDDNNWIIQN